MTKETLEKAKQLDIDIHNLKLRIQDLEELIANPNLETKVWDSRGSSMIYEVIELDPIPFLQASLDNKLLVLQNLEAKFESL